MQATDVLRSILARCSTHVNKFMTSQMSSYERPVKWRRRYSFRWIAALVASL